MILFSYCEIPAGACAVGSLVKRFMVSIWAYLCELRQKHTKPSLLQWHNMTKRVQKKFEELLFDGNT